MVQERGTRKRSLHQTARYATSVLPAYDVHELEASHISDVQLLYSRALNFGTGKKLQTRLANYRHYRLRHAGANSFQGQP